MSDIVNHLLTRIRQLSLPAPECEYRFDIARRWRFDLAWPDRMLAAEIDGGTWAGGRHTRPAGYERDCEKLNAAAEAGWRVFRYTSRQVIDDEAIIQLERVLTEVS